MRHTREKHTLTAPAKSDVTRMRRLLETVESSLMRAELFSKDKGFRSCERTLLHMISHAQTLKESLRSKKPGFA